MGRLLTSFEIWALEKPWDLSRASTESGFAGVQNWTRLEAAAAASGERPHD